jgi:hypothetical protein
MIARATQLAQPRETQPRDERSREEPRRRDAMGGMSYERC